MVAFAAWHACDRLFRTSTKVSGRFPAPVAGILVTSERWGSLGTRANTVREGGMDTGYSIDDNRIYGPKGYAECWIEGDGIYSSRGGYTQCLIAGRRIDAGGVGTGFYIDGGRIYGPSKRLPWKNR